MDSDIYFFIYYPRIQKEVSSDIKFENCKDIPDCIYIDEKFENSIYHYKKV